MSSLALTSGWYYICTSYCTPDTICLRVKWDYNLVSISSILFSFFVNFAVNCSLLSDTILSGNPYNFYILSLNNHTSSFVKASFVVVTKYVILDNLSQTTRIMSFSVTSGNFVIKSTITYVHSFSDILLNFNFSASASILFFIF